MFSYRFLSSSAAISQKTAFLVANIVTHIEVLVFHACVFFWAEHWIAVEQRMSSWHVRYFAIINRHAKIRNADASEEITKSEERLPRKIGSKQVLKQVHKVVSGFALVCRSTMVYRNWFWNSFAPLERVPEASGSPKSPGSPPVAPDYDEWKLSQKRQKRQKHSQTHSSYSTSRISSHLHTMT